MSTGQTVTHVAGRYLPSLIGFDRNWRSTRPEYALRGVQLAISDAHAGLRDAIAATLPGAAWQRCRTHFMRNLLTKSAQGLVATLVRMVFAEPDAELTRAQHARVVEQLEARWPTAAELLRDGEADLLGFASLPKEHRRQIWSNNPRSGSTASRSGGPTSSGSSRTAMRSSVSWERYWPSSLTSEPSCGATSRWARCYGRSPRVVTLPEPTTTASSKRRAQSARRTRRTASATATE